MISFKNLGGCGLGNQLFRYAFLRSTALRLRVKFYCPKWVGDDIFLLGDGNEREKEQLRDINKVYIELRNSHGFNKSALYIKDHTDINGCFQTEKYFYDKEKVKKWYTFREKKISSVKEKYKHIDFSKSVGLHLRFGDKKKLPEYYNPSFEYYADALLRVKHKENILVFSDEIKIARKKLKGLKGNVIYVEGNKDYEDLYLMSLSHDFICSGSTFSWWGAWLNNYRDKTIVVPKEGLYRPDCKKKCIDYYCNGWLQIRALRKGMLDNYWVIYILCFPNTIGREIDRIIGLFGIYLKKKNPRLYFTLKNLKGEGG